MNQTAKKILFTTMAVIVLLTACLPQQPTQSPEDTANQIATSVALTVAAQSTQTAAAQPLPTNTTLPTQTESVSPTPLTPTATPFVIVPPTMTVVSSGGGGGGGGGAAPSGWDCTPINNRPRDNTVFKKNNEFDIKWTIVNTGTKTIPANLDIKYFSGPKMMKPPTATVREFGVDLKPGESVTIIMDAVAPVEKGFHVMTWRVEGNPTPCAPYVAIIVE